MFPIHAALGNMIGDVWENTTWLARHTHIVHFAETNSHKKCQAPVVQFPVGIKVPHQAGPVSAVIPSQRRRLYDVST